MQQRKVILRNVTTKKQMARNGTTDGWLKMTYYCGRLKAILSFWTITNRINNDDTTLYAYVTEVYPEGRDKQQP